MIQTQYINLNMVPSGVLPVLYCSQYDVGRPLGLVVYNGGEAVDLSTYTCTIEGTRTDGTAITTAVTTGGNVGAFATTATMTNQADKYLSKLVLADSDGNRVASLAFVMCVTPRTMDENAESIEEDASLYQQYTGTVQTLIADIRQNLEAEIANRQAAVTAEARTRGNADATLQSNINAEAATRAAADTSLQANINAETAARTAADDALSTRIDNLTVPSGSAPSAAEIIDARVGENGRTYDTLGEAIRAQAGASVRGSSLNINNDNKGDICGGTFDGIPVNTMYGVTTGTVLVNAPDEESDALEGGWTAILSQGRTAVTRTGMVQIYINSRRVLYVRMYWSGSSWTGWSNLGTDQDKIPIGRGSIDATAAGSDYSNLISHIVKPGGYNLLTASAWTDAPDGMENSAMLYVFKTSAAYMVQIVYNSIATRIWYRVVNTNNYTPYKEWVQFGMDTGVIFSRRGSASASNYGALLSNIFAPGAYMVAMRDYTDCPVVPSSAANALLMVYPVNSVFAVQMLFGTGVQNRQVYWRIVRSSGEVYSSWRPLNSLNPRNILGIGDSICEGGRNSNRGFVGILGLPYVNAGVGGATISTVRDATTHWIENQLTAQTDDFDAVIMEGGYNDFIYNAPLGTLSQTPIRTSDTTAYEALDVGTICGALEHLFITCISKYPDADRFFLISHKTRNYPWTPHFTGGYTQEQLHDTIVAACKLYNVQVIDVYAESPINTYFPEYYSPTAWSSDNSVGDSEWVDSDQVHPLSFGYLHGYLPLIQKALEASSHK